ncbi:hypothetical protein Pmani_020664 [Petrolisthes manimaculis]|uniref:Uncharacterized protein n=1 Tax=Petrolisthes manimaculis TaxID=1843537 RepID=A0AAE1U432_9EUCA|nr:hypothetical protein Pmani_020664 [Petrolisthes manimaculis]
MIKFGKAIYEGVQHHTPTIQPEIVVPVLSYTNVTATWTLKERIHYTKRGSQVLENNPLVPRVTDKIALHTCREQCVVQQAVSIMGVLADGGYVSNVESEASNTWII